MRTFAWGILGVATLLTAKSLASVGDPDDRRVNARETLKAYLASKEGSERGAVVDVKSESLARTFKNVEFFGLRFSHYPVAVVPQLPLKRNNVFAVVGDDVVHIVDQEQLEVFFRKKLVGEQPDSLWNDATLAWLKLTQELHEDGYFRFQKPEAKLLDSSCRGELSVVPRSGDRGKLTVKITLDGRRFSEVETGGKIMPGVRPRCQATRLLDPDPVVREIMRHDILVLGRRCKPYLDEVRNTASPRLKRAIDGVWQQILAEDR